MTSVLKWLQDRKGILFVVLVLIIVGCLFYKNNEGFYAIETDVEVIYKKMRDLRNESLSLDRTSKGVVVTDTTASDIKVSFYDIEPKVHHYLKLRLMVQDYLNSMGKHLYNLDDTKLDTLNDEHKTFGFIGGEDSDIMNWGTFTEDNNDTFSLLLAKTDTNDYIDKPGTKLKAIEGYIKDNFDKAVSGTLSIETLIDSVKGTLDVTKGGSFYDITSNKAANWGKVHNDMTTISTTFTAIGSKIEFIIDQFTALQTKIPTVTNTNDELDYTDSGLKTAFQKILNTKYKPSTSDTSLTDLLTNLIGDDDLGSDADKGLRNNLGALQTLIISDDVDKSSSDTGELFSKDNDEESGLRKKIVTLHDQLAYIQGKYGDFNKVVDSIVESSSFTDVPRSTVANINVTASDKDLIDKYIDSVVTNLGAVYTDAHIQQDIDDIEQAINNSIRTAIYAETETECNKLIGNINDTGSPSINGFLNNIFKKLITSEDVEDILKSIDQVSKNSLDGYNTTEFEKANNFFLLLEMYEHFEDYLNAERNIYTTIFKNHHNGETVSISDYKKIMVKKNKIINGYETDFKDDISNYSDYFKDLKDLIFEKVNESVVTTTQASTTEAQTTTTVSGGGSGGGSDYSRNASGTGQRCVIRGLQGDLNHIVSNYSGASYDFKYFGTGEDTEKDVIMVYQKPIRSGEHTHVFAVNDNGNLVTQPEDENNAQQQWFLKSTSDSDSLFEVVSNYNSVEMALNQDSSYLSLKPYQSGFQGSKWKVINGQPSTGLLSCNPALPHQSVASPVTQVESQYAKQLSEIMTMVKRNSDLYQKQVGDERTASSVFGKSEPLRLKVNLLSSSDDVEGDNFNNVEKFQDSSKGNVLGLLDSYERNQNGSPLGDFTPNPNAPKCKSVNYDDYTENRVGQCNCIV